MAEWLIALDSKSSVPARVPGVQIPLSPPINFELGFGLDNTKAKDAPRKQYVIVDGSVPKSAK